MKNTLKTITLTLMTLYFLTACGQENSGSIKPYNENEALPKQDIKIINLWASWCQPCQKEIPELSAFAKQHPEIAVMGIALDQPENVEKFLQTTPVSYPIRYHNEDATSVFLRFGNHTGGIPYTVIDAPKCNFRKSYFGTIHREQLEDGIAQAQKQCPQ